jgi:rubrerythrin
MQTNKYICPECGFEFSNNINDFSCPNCQNKTNDENNVTFSLYVDAVRDKLD